MEKFIVNSSLSDIHIKNASILISPDELKKIYPIQNNDFVHTSRKIISNIIHKIDDRLLVVCGPCSIHDVSAALDYAKKLKNLSDKLKDKIFIVMRVYFEKPRTTVGWKGLINDPDLDDSFDMEKGLKIARKLLIDITNLGLPIATEALDPITPQYIDDLISWSAIGARTTESQTHREMASGLSMPVGFKNGTDGSLDVAINAMKSAASPHRFFGINSQGKVAILSTSGNKDGHIILRGGVTPNYEEKFVNECEQFMLKNKLNTSIMIDCSHANSYKNYKNQPKVIDDVIEQIKRGNNTITGLMIESNLNEGNQTITTKDKLLYGVSLTDGCINWQTTEEQLYKIAEI